ncbi:MAG: DUF4956 domain-containing protein [Bacteroidota bacterium]|jgi:hypothetical protein|uniref:DUF4956 domain-containing protein n=1 Tax=Candidatus Pollutiaquabacter sp. TaxID=3416354 RepID=UPI001A3F423E|nr:DUF4956 domain-containing protein [Bacteroidota bacterium]MBL7948933.1 DUF4956 domain-containing protein [Bacteroidia bacterium]HRS38170.1 DUF4956 domain-containing protein [Bacteroidia bacterium]HRU60317.1 DUF4956 domain-containing protein [Bacteroidia bacterium]
MNDAMTGFELFDKLSDKFFIRLLIDIVSMLVLVRLIYFRIYKKKDYLFTFFLFNIIIFIITYLLNKVDMSMGAAFGLFAVFSMLRYRTEGITTKDMTYLFIVIAIGLICAVSKATYFELGVINLILIGFTYALDGNWLVRNEMIKTVQYENIDLIRPENYQLLLEDLRKRTGLNIHRASINKIDFLKDIAVVKVYYYEDTVRHSK